MSGKNLARRSKVITNAAGLSGGKCYRNFAWSKLRHSSLRECRSSPLQTLNGLSGVCLVARLVRFLFDARDPQSVQKLCSACQENQILNAECGNWFAPVTLDSDEARQLREELRQEKEWKTPKLLQPTPSERLKLDLQNIEAGQVAYWVQLTLDLTLEATSTRYPSDVLLNLTQTPGWNAADPVTRERILRAAVQYINEGYPHNDQWFGTSSIFNVAIGGFHALALLMVAHDER